MKEHISEAFEYQKDVVKGTISYGLVIGGTLVALSIALFLGMYAVLYAFTTDGDIFEQIGAVITWIAQHFTILSIGAVALTVAYFVAKAKIKKARAAKKQTAQEA